jgi:hypothetical protein
MKFNMENLQSLFHALDLQLAAETKEEIASLEEPEASIRLHLSLNALIRSLAFYKNPSTTGAQYFGRLGLPDDASYVFGKLYWWHLKYRAITASDVATLVETTLWLMPDEVQEITKDLMDGYASYRKCRPLTASTPA